MCGDLIFTDSFLEKNRTIKDEDFLYFCEYIPKGKVNYVSDSRSKNFVLGFKNGDENVSELLFDAISPFIGNNFAIAVVPPSSRSKNYKTSCHKFANLILQRLGSKNSITDATQCLYRNANVMPLHFGANRFDEERAKTIIVEDGYKVKGKDVLLIDDVYTTGETMRSCINKLKEAGASSVICFAVGRTVDDRNPRYAVIFDLDQTLYDTSSLEQYREQGKWKEAVAGAHKLKANPYPGVREILSEMRRFDFKTCIATSSPENYAKVFADELGITNVVSYHDTRKHKPDTEPYCRAKQLLQAYEKNIIVVGDNENDIVPAKALSMVTVLIGRENACGADYSFSSFEDFYNDFDQILNKLFRKRNFS